VNRATFEIIKKWFIKLTPLSIKTIKPKNRWNMDETRIIKSIGDNSLVVESAFRRFIQKKRPSFRA
jgi:hypothetical protein